MHVFWTIVLFIVGLILIIKGGDYFVDAATWIAKKSGIPQFIIGATIVSIATTLPELVASIVGTVEGSLGLAVGNAIGSVTANTGMIMAISIIFMPGIINRKQYGFKMVLLLLITFLLGVFLLDGHLNILESIIVCILVIVFFVENVINAKQSIKSELHTNETINEPNQDNEEKNITSKKEIIINIAKFILGAVGIFFGAKLLVSEGTELARLIGISEEIIGLTLVAIGTSLPELVTTITALVKKQSSLSIGNIVGANIIDMSLILPICAFISGGKLQLESMQTAYLDIPVSLLIMVIAFVPTLINKKFSRLQGILMLLIYIAYLIVICGGFIKFN